MSGYHYFEFQQKAQPQTVLRSLSLSDLHFMNPNRQLAVAESCQKNFDSKLSVWDAQFADPLARQTGYSVR